MFTDRLKRKVYQNHDLVGGSNKKVLSSNVSKSGRFQSFHLITGIKLTDSKVIHSATKDFLINLAMTVCSYCPLTCLLAQSGKGQNSLRRLCSTTDTAWSSLL